MKNKTMILIGLAVISSLWLWQDAGGQQPQAQGIGKIRWEYATFSFNRSLPSYGWYTPTDQIVAKSWAEFGSKYPKPFKVSDLPMTGIMNAVGADGWELCIHEDPVGSAGSETWTFKRLAP